MKPSYQHFRRHTAGILGAVFLISGLLKLVDPVGTMLIVEAYLKFFHLAFLDFAAKVLGVLLALTECAVGIGLITGVFRKLSAVMAYSMLGFFTLITLLLWIFNPAMSCGCFGQAIRLTHAQSFWKNIVLLVLAVIAFTPFKEFGTPRVHKNVAAGVALAALIAGTVYSHLHLPVLDFTPFDWGSQLFASLDDNAEEADFRRAPILSFCDAEGHYQDELAVQGKVVVLSVYDASRADWTRVVEHYRRIQGTEALALLLVSAGRNELAGLGLPPDVPLYFSDYRTLISLNRSNGGGSYFHDGEVMHKWSVRDMPDSLEEDIADDPLVLSTRHVTRRRLTAQGFCVGLLAILLLL